MSAADEFRNDKTDMARAAATARQPKHVLFERVTKVGRIHRPQHDDGAKACRAGRTAETIGAIGPENSAGTKDEPSVTP